MGTEYEVRYVSRLVVTTLCGRLETSLCNVTMY